MIPRLRPLVDLAAAVIGRTGLSLAIATAIGRVDEANGCMRLVNGSHHLGALDLVGIGQSQGTDPGAVAAALESHPVELCELDPGDVVVFHSNTLHGSGPNTSDTRRTMLMMSYNAISIESDT